MRWVENLSRKEIAQRMGITVTTVDIHLKKALEYLRAAVAKLPGESLGALLLAVLLSGQ
jgi:DNA-directed RNA polymerase specialized sigma24 family protein